MLKQGTCFCFVAHGQNSCVHRTFCIEDMGNCFGIPAPMRDSRQGTGSSKRALSLCVELVRPKLSKVWQDACVSEDKPLFDVHNGLPAKPATKIPLCGKFVHPPQQSAVTVDVCVWHIPVILIDVEKFMIPKQHYNPAAHRTGFKTETPK
mmetsp:Transcript_4968/g.11922  ORF Transcript_4968/g.11922 Transcript_4968/m.11922 type:complete len:150 (-) Transcript_4968:225-674(-)